MNEAHMRAAAASRGAAAIINAGERHLCAVDVSRVIAEQIIIGGDHGCRVVLREFENGAFLDGDVVVVPADRAMPFAGPGGEQADRYWSSHRCPR